MLENNECSRIISENYLLPDSETEGYQNIDVYIERLDEFAEDIDYTRLVIFELIHSGEVATIDPIALRFMSDDSVHIINLKPKERGKSEFIETTVSNLDINEVYNILDEAEKSEALSFYKLLIVDYQSKDSCDCRFYSDLDPKIFDQIRDLSFFK